MLRVLGFTLLPRFIAPKLPTRIRSDRGEEQAWEMSSSFKCLEHATVEVDAHNAGFAFMLTTGTIRFLVTHSTLSTPLPSPSYLHPHSVD